MRTLRLTLCLVALATLYPAVSNAAQICYSAYVPAASPQWRSGCDGEMAGTTGHSWGVTLYAISSPDPSVGGGSICYSVYTPHGWYPQCNGTPIGYGTDAIRLLKVTSYSGASTLKYRAHVGNVGWMPTVDFTGNAEVGMTNQTLQALEVNIALPGESQYWQQ